MKLRIRGDSIRLRLTKSEVAQLGETGRVEETTDFGVADARLRYKVESRDGDETVRADYYDDCICVSVPKSIAEKWINSKEISIEAKQSFGTDISLRILIEKDFACITERSGENETDAFPNPAADGL